MQILPYCIQQIHIANANCIGFNLYMIYEKIYKIHVIFIKRFVNIKIIYSPISDSKTLTKHKSVFSSSLCNVLLNMNNRELGPYSL